MDIRYGIAESIGFRSRMEDSHAVWDVDDQDLFAAEVYDGHNGPLAATIAAEILTPHLLSSLRGEPANRVEKFPLREQIRKPYLSTDEYIIGQGIESGAAAATLHIVDGKFCAANSGDSRVIIDQKLTLELLFKQIGGNPQLPGQIILP